MAGWHGYFVAERATLGQANWDQLIALFDDMGTAGSQFPAYNLQKRVRLDGDAALYESMFDPDNVSGAAFRQMLADEFGVPVEEIEQGSEQDDYAGYETSVWTYSYGGVERFIIRRFAIGDQPWGHNRQECVGYLVQNSILWDGIDA